MQTNLYTYVGVFTRGLDTLAHLLKTGAEFARSKGVSEAEMLDWKLAEDMFTARQQAHVVIRFAGSWAARMVGAELPRDPDHLQTLAELQAGIQETKAQLAALKPEQFDGRDEVPLTVNIGVMEPTLPTAQWVAGFAIPNFYFHLSMLYAILRQRGAALGKRDFFAGGL